MLLGFWKAVAQVTEFMTSLPTLMYEHQFTVNVIAVLLIVGVIAYFFLRDKKARRKLFLIQRGRKMTRQERQEYLRDLIGDKICDVIEDLEFNGKISRPEARTIYRRLGQVLHIKALLPNKKEPALSKAELEKVKSLLFPKAVNIPGPKPGENVIPFVAAQPRKKLGAGYAARKAKTA